jgi:hypothetical protein
VRGWGWYCAALLRFMSDAEDMRYDSDSVGRFDIADFFGHMFAQCRCPYELSEIASKLGNSYQMPTV